MSELTQEFWDQLDETPQRRGGGFIVAIGDAGEHRSRSRLEAANARLAIFQRQLEEEERR